MVWTFAQAIQEQVERFGAYAGIVAFFGLALLAILYFAQARELKRLRDWAGRAPERARELEERVLGQAPASATPVPAAPAASAVPGAPVAPRPKPSPVPPGAAAAAAAAATGAPPESAAEAAESKEGAETGEAAPIPEPGAVPAAANGAGGEGASPPAVAANGATAPPKEDEPDAAETARPDAEKAPSTEPPTVVAAAHTDGDGPAPEEVDAEGDGGDDRPAEPSAPVPSDSPSEAVIPAATAVRPGRRPAGPRPATAAALRSTNPSATPPRRPSPPARPAVSTPPSRRRGSGRTALIALAAFLALGGGALAITSLGGDDPATEPERAEVSDPLPTATAEAEATPDVTELRDETTVAVLNGTTINGLAAQAAQQLSRVGYVEGPRGNYTPDQQRAESAVLFRDGFEDRAQDVGEVLGISRVEPMNAEARAQPIGDAPVLVIVGHDQAP